MSGITGSKQNSQRRSLFNPSLRHRHTVVSSGGIGAAIELMGPGNGFVIPVLEGMPAEHNFTAGNRAFVALARTLLELGLADPADWKLAHKDSASFVQVSLDRWVKAHGGETIDRQFELGLTLTDSLNGEFDEEEMNPSGTELFLTLGPASVGYVACGPTLRLLESIHPRLPATFYRFFVGSLMRWIRVYDMGDAKGQVEMLREMIDGEAGADEYEIPDIDGAVPKSLGRRPLSKKGLRYWAKRTRNSSATSILQQVLKLASLSEGAARPQLAEAAGEQMTDMNSPLPSLLAVFEKGDAIEACFDEESRTMLEYEPEPNVILPLNARVPESVERSFHSLGVVCDTLAAASQLIALMPGNEKSSTAG
jgi:hypothetical protein